MPCKGLCGKSRDASPTARRRFTLALFLKTGNTHPDRFKECTQLVLQPSHDLQRVLIDLVQLLRGGIGCFAQMRGSRRVSFSDDLSCARLGINQYALAPVLSLAEDRTFFQSLRPFLFGLLHCPPGTFVGFAHDLFAHFDDLCCIAKVGWDSEPHLIDHVQYALAVDHKVSTDG